MDRRQETGDRRQETGDRRQETGDRRQKRAFGFTDSCPLSPVSCPLSPVPCPSARGDAVEEFCMTRLSAMDLLREGISAAQAGDVVRARKLLSETTALDPINELAWLWYAGAVETPRETLTCLQRVLEINPHNNLARTNILGARVRAAAGALKARDRSAARDLLMQVLAEEPDHEEALVWMAAAAESAEEAIPYLQRTLALDSDNLRAKAGLEYYRSQLAKSAPAWQCPFCQHRGTMKQTACPNCRAVLQVGNLDAVLDSNADPEKLRPAITRLTAAGAPGPTPFRSSISAWPP